MAHAASGREILISTGRDCVITPGGQLLAITEHIHLDADDVRTNREVRFRTVGDATCTAAVESPAITVDDIIQEIIDTKISALTTRLSDHLDPCPSFERVQDEIAAAFHSWWSAQLVGVAESSGRLPKSVALQ